MNTDNKGGFLGGLFNTLVETAMKEVEKVVDVQLQSLTGQTVDELQIGRFVARNDGTAYDTTTGLTWTRYVAGQRWENGLVTGSARDMGWNEASEFVDAVNKRGLCGEFYDWRLPTINELESIYDQGKKRSINRNVFPKIADTIEFFWSSTSSNPLFGKAMYRFSFMDQFGGDVNRLSCSVDGEHHAKVRFVRG